MQWTEQSSDISLFDAWGRGERQAGTLLVRRYFRSVFSFFHHRLPAEADDLAQRTFLACIEARDRFRGTGTFRAFLFGIARRQLLKRLEKADVSRRHRPLYEDPAGAASPSTVVAGREEQRLLLAGLRMLTLEQQILLELFYWERMSTEEIGSVVGASRAAIKVRLHRARAQLRSALEQCDASDHLRTQTIRSLDEWVGSLKDRED